MGALQDFGAAGFAGGLAKGREAARRRPGYLLREVFLFVVRLPPFFAPFFAPFFLAIRSSSHPNVSLPGGA